MSKQSRQAAAQKEGRIRLAVEGMHCASCEMLIEQKLQDVPGVRSAKVSRLRKTAEIRYAEKPDIARLQEALAGTGYSLFPAEGTGGSLPAPGPRDYLEIGGILVAVGAAYLVLRKLNLVPAGLSVQDTMSYPFVFALGLVAAASSCIAVTGGLLVAVAGRYAESHPSSQGWSKFKPHLQFNAGRVAGYTALGGAVGGLGSVFTLSTRMTGVVAIAASLVMTVLGFQLLDIFPRLHALFPKTPKFLARRIGRVGNSSGSEAAPFLLGASTFFLPCGFTQALQIYVLAKGSFMVGALTMLAFSLGTLPALLSLGALSSFLKGKVRKRFFRLAGALAILIGISTIGNGLGLALGGLDLSDLLSPKNTVAQTASLVEGKQVLRMRIVGYEYQPPRFSVRQGIPVEWHIDGSQAAGCAGVVTAPDLGLTASAAGSTDKVVAFTPLSSGRFAFSCPMGMTTKGAAITVLAGSPAVTSSWPATGDFDRQSEAAAQRYSMTVTKEKGFYPNHFAARANAPVELSVDVQTSLGGCMSTMIGSDYGIAVRLNQGNNLVRFTPTHGGTVRLTCPMGSPMGEFTISE